MSRPREPTPGWKAVAAATSDGVGILDGDRFAYADDRLAELFGYGSGTGDLVDREWRELCAARERDRIDREVLPHVRSGTPWRGTVTGQRADGSTFSAELSLYGSRGELVVWTATDAAGATVGGAGSRETPAPEGVDDTHRQLFDTAPVPIGVFTADDEIVYCNQAAVEFLGADRREDVVGRSPEAFVHPDDRERVGRRITQVIDERESTAPLKERFVGLDGEERVAVVASRPATYDGEPAAQVVMNDVTDYERAQAQLDEKRLFLQGVMDAVDDLVYVLDEDGEFHDWNEEAVETLGYTDEELADMHPVDVIPEDQHEYIPGLLEAIDDIDDRRVDVDLLTKEGERLTHEFKGTTFEHPGTGERFRCGVARDVTEVRELQRELREEHRFVQNVVDALEDVLYVVDEDGTFVLWNDEANDRFGYTDDEMAELDPRDFVPPAVLEELPLDPVDIFDLPGRHDIELVTSGGEVIPHELHGVTYTDEETDRRYRVGIARNITERLERERELERYETIIETVDDGVYAFDEELRFTYVNDRLCAMFGRPRDDLLGERGSDFFGDEELERAAETRDRILPSDEGGATIYGTYPTEDGERILESRYRLHPDPDDEFRGSVGVVRDVTERMERERALERQRDELSTLDRINELLFDVIDELVETTTRRSVEEKLCDRLATSDLYRFAWTGERELDSDRIVPRTTAGDDGGYLEGIADAADGSVAGDGPAGRAILTGEVQVVNVDSADFEPWREAALDRGFESIVAVPLRYRETVYGVLVVYATRSDAFSEREQQGFAVLGETVGFAIDAVQRRRLLFADAVTELEFRLTDPDSFLARASDAHDCRLSVPGHVSADDRWILYVDVDGVSAERIVEAAADDPAVERVRVVGNAETGRLELVGTDTSLMHRTTPTGVQVRSIEFESGTGRLVVESPAESAARDVVEQFDSTFASVELLARQERDRPIEIPQVPVAVIGSLTDRQREVLEAAFHAGYFAWPRASTAEEVADALGIAPATFHAHVRKAEMTIVSALFD